MQRRSFIASLFAAVAAVVVPKGKALPALECQPLPDHKSNGYEEFVGELTNRLANCPQSEIDAINGLKKSLEELQQITEAFNKATKRLDDLGGEFCGTPQ